MSKNAIIKIPQDLFECIICHRKGTKMKSINQQIIKTLIRKIIKGYVVAK